MKRVHIRYHGRSWATDEQLQRQAEMALLRALATTFGGMGWHVRQAIEAPGMTEAIALIGESRGWHYVVPQHLGRVLTELRDRGAPLVREPRGGVVFWRLTAAEPSAPAPVVVHEPVATHGAQPQAPVRVQRRPSARRVTTPVPAP